MVLAVQSQLVLTVSLISIELQYDTYSETLV